MENFQIIPIKNQIGVVTHHNRKRNLLDWTFLNFELRY